MTISDLLFAVGIGILCFMLYPAFFPDPLEKTIYTYTSDFKAVNITVFDDDVECSYAYKDSVRLVISQHTLEELMKDYNGITLEIKEHFDKSYDEDSHSCEPTELITDYTFHFER